VRSKRADVDYCRISGVEEICSELLPLKIYHDNVYRLLDINREHRYPHPIFWLFYLARTLTRLTYGPKFLFASWPSPVRRASACTYELIEAFEYCRGLDGLTVSFTGVPLAGVSKILPSCRWLHTSVQRGSPSP